MKDVTQLLMRIIANDTKYVESMRHSLKEDGVTILQLQNKSRFIEKEIEERKQIIEEYRSYLRDISEATYTRMNLMPSTGRQMDTESSTTKIKLVKSVEKQE